MRSVIVETERLRLREMTYDDADAILAVFSDKDSVIYYPYEFNEERSRFWIFCNLKRYAVFSFGTWAVELKETGELIGDCGLTMQMINKMTRPEIGYHMRKDQRGKGYAAEAARAVRDWAFERTPFQIVYSYMKAENVASYKTAEAAGLRLIEEYTDEDGELQKMYAITREEWEKLKKA